MDSNNTNISSGMQTSAGAIDHFFPTSLATSSHFFDPAFLDTSLPFPTSAATSSWAQPPPPPPPTNSLPKQPAADPGGPTGQRPSKKRARASRRAPTTVLTTDASNFRAMVQEFTGIPAPPFTSSSTSTFPLHFPRSLNPPPSFLLKPFPHKLQPPHFPTSSLTSPLPPPVPRNSFQSLLQSQLLSVPLQQQQQQQSMAASSSSSSVELRQQNFPVGPTEFRAEKGSEGREGLMEAWICSSD